MSDADAVLDTVCGSAIRLLNAAPGIVRVHVQAGDAWVTLERAAVDPVTAVAPVAAELPKDPAGPENASFQHVRAPMVGTFYRSPGPDEPPFVSEGDIVEPGQQIGIIEAMKLMNSIEADRGGQIVEILVPNGTSVEYDQPLMTLISITATETI